MRAVLRLVSATPALADADIFSPALGTGVGALDPVEAGREIAEAYADWKRAE